jgi:hypothetical protein
MNNHDGEFLGFPVYQCPSIRYGHFRTGLIMKNKSLVAISILLATVALNAHSEQSQAISKQESEALAAMAPDVQKWTRPVDGVLFGEGANGTQVRLYHGNGLKLYLADRQRDLEVAQSQALSEDKAASKAAVKRIVALQSEIDALTSKNKAKQVTFSEEIQTPINGGCHTAVYPKSVFTASRVIVDRPRATASFVEGGQFGPRPPAGSVSIYFSTYANVSGNDVFTDSFDFLPSVTATNITFGGSCSMETRHSWSLSCPTLTQFTGSAGALTRTTTCSNVLNGIPATQF